MKSIAKLVLAATVAISFHAYSEADTRGLTIDEMFSLLENNNHQLLALKSGEAAAEENISTAKGQWLPDINTQLSLSYNSNALITSREFDNSFWSHVPHLGNHFTVDVHQMLYSGGAIPANIKIAELGREQAATQTQLTRQQQRLLAVAQYLDIFKINNGIKVYEKNIELTNRLIDNIREKYNQGMALRNDITRYELQLENLKLGLEKLENQRTIMNHSLCNTLGLDPTTVIVPDEPSTLMSQATEEEWQQQAGIVSPLIKQSKLNVQLAEQQEKLAKSELLPKISLFAANDFNGPITVEVPPLNKNLGVWYVGVGISYNLSSLYKAKHKVKASRNAREQSQQLALKTAQDIDNAVQSAYTLYKEAQVEHNTQLKSVQLAQQNYEVINERYLNQMALITDMIDASNVKLNAELQEVDARINIIMAYYKMCYAAGNL